MSAKNIHTVPKPWINFLNPKRASDSTDIFYDRNQLEWTKPIEQQWQVLRDDILQFLDTNTQELKSFYRNQQKWKSFGLYAWGMNLSPERCKKLKTTVDILKQVPGIVTIMVGVMEPNSEIAGHLGDTDAIYRCHLPLIVPGTLPEIGFQVEEEQRSWVEGEFLIFNDAKFHRAWNHTSERRIVLIIDVLKPEYRDQAMKICSKVLSGLAIQKIAQKIPPLKYVPAPLLRLVDPLLRIVISRNLRSKKGTDKSLL